MQEDIQGAGHNQRKHQKRTRSLLRLWAMDASKDWFQLQVPQLVERRTALENVECAARTVQGLAAHAAAGIIDSVSL